MFSVLTNMPSTQSVVATYTTFAASAMLLRSILNEIQNMNILPQGIQEKLISKIFGKLSPQPQMTLIIDEYNSLTYNQLYEASQLYLRTKITPSTQCLKVSKSPTENEFSVTVNKGEKIVDSFQGIQLVWEMISVENQKTVFDTEGYNFSSENVERKSINLSFDRKHKDKVLKSFLPFVMERSMAMKEENKVVKLYALGGNFYGDTDLKHPSTFDTLALDPAVKKELMDDLDRFLGRRDYYRRVGKAWKRGYLLYGPPGTGKSSLIAAMANYLKFDVYDLELASLQSNSNLRNLLLSTANRSILVIEDIDCSVEFQNRQLGGHHTDSQLTLSGLLNFIDGLWSSCGDERIIVFTTNHKERLDPALLRPGRMDVHIHMSYCTPCGFKILVNNYLGIDNHSLFGEIEQVMDEVEVTPAEIAEQLMKSDKADIALGGILELLRRKKSTEGSESNDAGEMEFKKQKECKGIEQGSETKARKIKTKKRRGKSRI